MREIYLDNKNKVRLQYFTDIREGFLRFDTHTSQFWIFFWIAYSCVSSFQSSEKQIWPDCTQKPYEEKNPQFCIHGFDLLGQLYLFYCIHFPKLVMNGMRSYTI